MINGRWIELDLTSINKYGTRKKDTSARTQDHSSYDLGLYAFSIYPNWRKNMPEDAIVNDYLMYGDPNDKKNNTSKIY